MYFHKKRIHPLKKYILPPKKTKQMYSTQKKYIFKKTKKYSQKVIFPKKMISRNYIPNKSSIPETNSYIYPPEKDLFPPKKQSKKTYITQNSYKIGYIPQKMLYSPKKSYIPKKKLFPKKVIPKRKLYPQKKVIFPKKSYSSRNSGTISNSGKMIGIENQISTRSWAQKPNHYPRKLQFCRVVIWLLGPRSGRDLVFNTYHFARISGSITFFWEYNFFLGI
jgi:hypothetical protein